MLHLLKKFSTSSTACGPPSPQGEGFRGIEGAAPYGEYKSRRDSPHEPPLPKGKTPSYNEGDVPKGQRETGSVRGGFCGAKEVGIFRFIFGRLKKY